MSARLTRIALLCLAVLPSACAFDDGEPWGRVELSLTASAPRALRTAEGRNITLERVELTVDAVALYAGSAAAETFDPSDPPEGCTLCHGGHCHCGDALIDYETLAAREAGGDGGPVLTVAAAGAAILDGPVALDGCPGGCEVPRGTLRRAEVAISGLRLVGRAGEDDFDLTLGLSVAVDAAIAVPFERGEPIDAGLALSLALPFELLDGVDPDAPEAEVLRENLVRFAALAVDVSR